MSDVKASSTRAAWRRALSLVLVGGAACLVWWYWPWLSAQYQAHIASADAPQTSGSAPGGAGARRGPMMGGGPTPVRVALVEQKRFEVFYKALGTVTPLSTVNVRTRVAGELVKITFTEGQKVQAGDLLALIDPRPYRIALKQAQGTFAQNQALLRNAELNAKRYRQLHAEDSIAKQTLDTQQAEVEQYQGLLVANQAAIDDAKLNLEYSEIRAPITGRLGLRQLDLGNLLSANDTTALVVITQTQPISVVFTIPEAELPPVLNRFRQGGKLLVQAWDRGERQLLGEGVLQSVDNQIDTTTGTLRLKGQFANEQEWLLPNQFVNVRLRVETLSDALVIPSAAVQYGAQGTFVYAVTEQNEVAVRTLRLGATDGAWTVVTEGLVVGDRVIVEGTDRLRAGMKVEVIDPQANASKNKGAQSGQKHSAGEGKGPDSVKGRPTP